MSDVETQTVRYCQACGTELPAGAAFCSKCGTSRTDSGRPETHTAGPAPSSLGPREKTALGGAALLAIGSFSPVASVPFGGSITYFNNGNGDGVIALILAVVALVVVFIRRWDRFVWIIGCIAAVMCVYDMANVAHMVSTSNNPFLKNTVSLQWGWGLLLIGCAMLVCSVFLASGRGNRSAEH